MVKVDGNAFIQSADNELKLKVIQSMDEKAFIPYADEELERDSLHICFLY